MNFLKYMLDKKTNKAFNLITFVHLIVINLVLRFLCFEFMIILYYIYIYIYIYIYRERERDRERD